MTVCFVRVLVSKYLFEEKTNLILLPEGSA